MTYGRRQTMPQVWHKLPTGELKMLYRHYQLQNFNFIFALSMIENPIPLGAEHSSCGDIST